MYYVYILKSDLDGRLYKGLTRDLPKRIKEHNQGRNRSTSAYKPWQLVYTEVFFTLEQARNREKYFKSGKGREYLKKIVGL
jgi:putative endonuclease